MNLKPSVTPKENVMAFVNEEISKEDWEKYNIDQINMRWNGCSGLMKVDTLIEDNISY